MSHPTKRKKKNLERARSLLEKAQPSLKLSSPSSSTCIPEFCGERKEASATVAAAALTKHSQERKDNPVKQHRKFSALGFLLDPAQIFDTPQNRQKILV